MPDNSPAPVGSTSRWPLWLAAAILVWGSLIALGAYLRYRDLGKPLVIFGTTVVFAAIWLLVAKAATKKTNVGSRDSGMTPEQRD